MEAQNALKIGFTQKSNEYFAGWTQQDVIDTLHNGVSENYKSLQPCETLM
jgi:hypothetical protein